MPNSSQRYIDSCPIGCQSGLKDSEILLPEGPLKSCTACGQLLSQCSTERYLNSMKEFDDPEGTWPSPDGFVRLLRHTKRLLSRIENLSGKKRSEIQLLDVGCSSGAFLGAAEKLGVTATGVEPAPGPAKTATESGLKVYQGFLQDLNLPRESFDVVTLFEVMEHVRDPLDLLRACHRVLRPSGLAVIRTGNSESWTVKYMKGRWEYFHLDQHGGHVSFYNPVSVNILAKRSGYMVKDLYTHHVTFYQKGEVPFLLYRFVKMLSELLNIPSTWFGKGDEMIAFLKKATNEVNLSRR